MFALFLRFCCIKYTPQTYILQLHFSQFSQILCFSQKIISIFIQNIQRLLFTQILCKHYANHFIDIFFRFFYNQSYKDNHNTGGIYERYHKGSCKARRRLSVNRVPHLFRSSFYQCPDKRTSPQSHAAAGL